MPCKANTGWLKPVDHALPTRAWSISEYARVVRQPWCEELAQLFDDIDDVEEEEALRR